MEHAAYPARVRRRVEGGGAVRRILTAFLLLPLIAFSQASDWYMDFDEDFAAASVRRFYLVGAKATNPYAEAKREAAEARAEKEALITELKESAGNPTAKSVSEIVSRHDRKNETVGGSLNKK